MLGLSLDPRQVPLLPRACVQGYLPVGELLEYYRDNDQMVEDVPV